ncbi:sedoheptulose 7-phosphate cyclase [Dokdonella sp.]|uniref:sedoheptulose 7-phosphate cyclase n=1 Tax=Dokdonella sp. TaxID=2291710 RepID=UPI0031C39C60|nr:sedoheptulose 7-phosphate cyclase [Dokdonella sp.]
MNGARQARWQVRTARPIAYDLVNVADVFDPSCAALASLGRTQGGRRFVVVDEAVHERHGERMRAWFAQQQIDARIVRIPGGEAAKTVATWQGLLRALDRFPIHRRDEPIIAIGGGVLTDVVAFVASSYRRGVPHIKVPTTLMGYVDAAVGVKCGINFNGYKNRLGSFEPPACVLLDRRFLTTLPLRHLHNGLCEIIKLAVIKDAHLFDLLERSGAASLACAFQDGPGGEILDRAIGGMLEELAPNLHEDELARKVDFGHTFSYGLETRFEERLLHGEAVLLDILVSCAIAHARHLLGAADARRILALIEHLGITPVTGLLDTELMWQSLRDRIEHRNGAQHVPLPTGLGGCCFANDITRREIAAAIDTLTEWSLPKHARIAEC